LKKVQLEETKVPLPTGEQTASTNNDVTFAGVDEDMELDQED
jgi:hypothetical protein